MYLSNAQALLGDAFDYAINACDISGNDFNSAFSCQISGLTILDSLADRAYGK